MEFIKFFFIYSNKEKLLFIGFFNKENPPIKFKNTTIKYLKYSFPIQDKEIYLDLLRKVYSPKYSKIVFSN